MSDIHSCSYFCTRPACVLVQRDELRAALAQQQVEPVVEPHKQGTDASAGQFMTQADGGNPSY